MKNFLIIIVIILIIVVVIFVNKKPPVSEEVKDSINIEETETQSQDEAVSPQAVNIIVNGSNFAFIPSTIKVKQGDIVNVTFTNSEGVHNLVVDEYNIATNTISAGGKDMISFTADKKGSFEYYCAVGNHQEMGMVGTLIVE